MKLLKTVLICLVIMGVFGGAMFALNLHTGPLIAANSIGAVAEILNKVMPNGSGYEDITETLSNLPAPVVKVYKETSGLGYAFECNATSKYTGSDPMNIFVGVDNTGKICGVSLEKHSESLIFGADYPSTYIGADSAMSGVELYAGSTFSSKAFKSAVEEGMNALIANNLIKAGEKSDEQILTELIATVHPDMAPGGVLSATKVNATGNITVAYRSNNNTGYAYVITKGDASYLVIVNVAGEAKVYDVDGNDVTAANADLTAEALAHVEIDKLSVLLAVLPENSALDASSLLYDFENAAASALKNVPASVKYVYKETNGLGFIVRCEATSQYTGSNPMDIILGVDATGKICGLQLAAHSESLIFGADYPNSYIGKDSALAGVELYAGSTFSSKAFKAAVEEGMSVLISNSLIAAGKKEDAQILEEMIPTVHTGMTFSGNLKATALDVSGNIVAGYKALNGSGYAFVVKNGDATVLVIVNALGNCTVYDIDGADVTADNTAACEEVLVMVEMKNVEEAAKKMILAAYKDATKITAIDFAYASNVVYAASFKSGGNTYYAFYSRPMTYEDNAMAVCTVIDKNGAIVSQDVKEFLFGHSLEYLPIYNQGYGNVSSDVFNAYEDLFNGITSDSVSDDLLVSGATLSSTAVKLATQDAFAAYDSIKGGN